MLATATSATLRGIDGQRVTVEVHVGNGLPAFTVVGLPDTSCREARDRVRAAIQSSGYRWPPSSRVTVNLAPSGVRKEGAGLDLAIALGVLAAGSGVVTPAELRHHGFLGELGLDGALRGVPGTLSLAGAMGEPAIIVAPGVAHEASLGCRSVVRPCRTLREVVECLQGRAPWPDLPEPEPPGTPPAPLDLADVAGHPFARRAIEVAAAGGHNVLLIGPPGTGKSMLARRLPGLLPDLDDATSLTTSRVHSVAGLALPAGGLIDEPPFRAPHHTASMAALIGGGSAGRFRPGEISCAHGGVLFLDELAEFSPRALEALRQPLEEGVVRISRAQGTVTFPADFSLVGAMNPCPCGLLGSVESCRCTDAARLRYARRLSGPLLDRIDLRVHMQRPSAAQLMDTTPGEATAQVRPRVLAVRAIARERGVRSNAALSPQQLERLAPMRPEAQDLVRAALSDGRLSARGLMRVRSVARTIADLAGDDWLDERAVAAALALRSRPALFDATDLHHV